MVKYLKKPGEIICKHSLRRYDAYDDLWIVSAMKEYAKQIINEMAEHCYINNQVKEGVNKIIDEH